MCFKFMNGSKTTKFLREHEVCLLKRRFRCRPRRLGAESPPESQGLRLQGSEASWDSVLRGRVVCSPDCHWTSHAPHQGPQTTGFWQRASQTHLQPDSGWRLTGGLLSGTPTLLQKGVMGFSPSVWQSPNPFSSRGKSWRLGYQVSIANVTHVLPVLGF